MAEQATQTQDSKRPSGAPSTVIVVNDSDRVKGFTFAVATGSGALQHEATRLTPGANRVSGDAFKRHADDFKADDQIWILDKPLSSLNEREARAVVERTIDVALLNAFAAVEKREEVRKLIAAQIESCSQRATPTNESTDEE